MLPRKGKDNFRIVSSSFEQSSESIFRSPEVYIDRKIQVIIAGRGRWTKKDRKDGQVRSGDVGGTKSFFATVKTHTKRLTRRLLIRRNKTECRFLIRRNKTECCALIR